MTTFAVFFLGCAVGSLMRELLMAFIITRQLRMQRSVEIVRFEPAPHPDGAHAEGST